MNKEEGTKERTKETTVLTVKLLEYENGKRMPYIKLYTEEFLSLTRREKIEVLQEILREVNVHLEEIK